jgi:hypothetical protein
MKNLKRKHYIIIAIVAVMILTNPSRSSFTSFLHSSEQSGKGRDFNGFIFSVYSTGKKYTREERRLIRSMGIDMETEKVYYIGILGNFFKTPF